MSAKRLRSNAQYRRYFGAQTFSMMGDAIGLVALPFALLEAGYGPGALGLVMTAVTAARLVGTLVAGVVADRIRRDRLMAGSDAIRALSQIAVFAVLATGTHNLALLLVLYLGFGFGSAFFFPAAQGMLAEVVERERRQQANAYLAAVDNLCSTLGPALAGIALTFVAAAYGVLADGVTFLLSGLLVLRLNLPDRVRAATKGSLRAESLAGFTTVRRVPWLRDGMLYNGALTALGFAPFFALVPFVTSRTDSGGSVWGVLLGAYGAGALIGSLAAVRIRLRRPLLYSFGLCAASWCVAFIAAPLISSRAWLLAIPIAAAGIGTALRGVIWDTALQSGVPERLIGRVSATDFLLTSSLLPLSYAVFGGLSEVLGPTRALVAAGVGLAALGGWFSLCGSVAATADELRVTEDDASLSRPIPDVETTTES